LFAPQHTADELKRLYDIGYFDAYPGGASYESDPAQRAYEGVRRVEFVRRYQRSGRLLEVGAAAGHFVEAADHAGFECMGVEPAEELAHRTTDRLGIRVVAGFIEEVALPVDHFDVVCAWHVIEHLKEPLNAISGIRRSMRPGGHVFVEVPNISSIYARRQGLRWANLDVRHHVGHYTPLAMRRLLQRSGFRVLSIETVPMRAYLRPGRAARPIEIAAAVKEIAILRTLPRRPHSEKHELLRAVAVVPDGSDDI
jgi:2-polyprenyl-3-methyl-5-hydroxy-6-metoxy-1,4-benzoquinol methylase